MLLLDTVHFHFEESVLMTMRRLHIQQLMVPASCTVFLQPLDACIFSLYKRVLRQRYHMLHVHVSRCVLPVAVCIAQHNRVQYPHQRLQQGEAAAL